MAKEATETGLRAKKNRAASTRRYTKQKDRSMDSMAPSHGDHGVTLDVHSCILSPDPL